MIIMNALRTPDGTELSSRHVHDYKTHIDKISGEEYMVDGGLDYLRRSVNIIPYTELSVTANDPHETCRMVKIWGTRGKDGKSKLKNVSASEMDDSHILKILEMNPHKSIEYVLKNEIRYRENERN